LALKKFGAFGFSHSGAWRYCAGAKSCLSIHPYGVVIAGADIRHVPMVPDGDFFDELQKAIC